MRLNERLEGYLSQVAGKLAKDGVEICNAGLVDSPERAVEAGSFFRRSEEDIFFLHVTTYALSSTVLPVMQRAKVPVVIMNLQPGETIDYAAFNKLGDRTKMTGDWLVWCSAFTVSEIAIDLNGRRYAAVAKHLSAPVSGAHWALYTIQPNTP